MRAWPRRRHATDRIASAYSSGPALRESCRPSLPIAAATRICAAESRGCYGAVRSGIGSSAIALHLICLSGQDGFPVHLRFRVPLEAGAGGFALAPAQLASIAPGRPVWIWAFARDLTFGPLRYTRPR